MSEGVRQDRLEALMAARGYGPGELAYQAGVSYNYIYKIRLGQAPHISAAQVAKLAGALRTSTGYLMGSTDDPTPQPVPSTQLVINEAQPAYVPMAREVAQLAARLNRLPAAARAKIIAAFGAVVELSEELAEATAEATATAEAPNAASSVPEVAEAEDQPGDPAQRARTARLIRLLDQLSDEDYQQAVAELDALLAAAAATPPPATVPARRVAGTRSGA